MRKIRIKYNKLEKREKKQLQKNVDKIHLQSNDECSIIRVKKKKKEENKHAGEEIC